MAVRSAKRSLSSGRLGGVGRTRIALCALLAIGVLAALTVFQADAAAATGDLTSFVETEKLTPSDGPDGQGDAFGGSIAIDDDTAVIGAPAENIEGDGFSAGEGAAYIFVRAGTTWTEQAKLIGPRNSELPESASMGHSVAIDGDTVIVGAPGETSNLGRGAAHVFVRSGSSWEHQATLSVGGDSTFDFPEFGASVAIRGDTAVVSNPQARVDRPNDQGQVYVFERSGGTWSLVDVLVPDDRASGEPGVEGAQYGRRLAFDGDTLLVSDLGESSGSVGTGFDGRIYSFVQGAGGWVNEARLDSPVPGAMYGEGLALEGDTAIVGTRDGRAFIVDRTGSTWATPAELVPDPRPQGSEAQLNGFAVALQGDTAVVDGRLTTTSGDSETFDNSVYVFERSGSAWSEDQRLSASDDNPFGDEFATAIALDGSTLMAGAPGKIEGNGLGATYAFASDTVHEGDLVVTDCDDPFFERVTAITGDLVIEGVNCAAGIALPNLTSVGGDVRVIDVVVTTLELPKLDQIGGTVLVQGLTGDLVGSLGHIGGELDLQVMRGCMQVSTQDVDGNVTVTSGCDDGPNDFTTGDIHGELDLQVVEGCMQVSTQDVDGNVTVTSGCDEKVELDAESVGGDVRIEADGAESVAATTANGTTDLTILGGTAQTHVVLPDGTFSEPVRVTIAREPDRAAEAGTSADGAAATVDPVGGYRFAFEIPNPGREAQLDLTIDLSRLDSATRAAVLAGAEDGSATMAVKVDAEGSTYQAFRRCTDNETPAANDCVSVALLDAGRSPVLGRADPASVRFSGFFGSFSTYAVALVSRAPQGSGTPAASGDGDSPAGTEPGGGDPSVATRLAFGPSTQVSLRLAARRIRPRRPLRVKILNRNGFAVTGSVSGRATIRRARTRTRTVALKATRFTVPARASARVALRLSRALRAALKRGRAVRLTLRAVVVDPAGNRREVKRTVRLKTSLRRR